MSKKKLKNAHNDGFFVDRLLMLLGYATSLLADYTSDKPITKESLAKISWFNENIERVVYQKLPMTEAP